MIDRAEELYYDLKEACANGDEDGIKKLIANGADPFLLKKKDNCPWEISAFVAAAHNGKIDIILYLLDRFIADISVDDEKKKNLVYALIAATSMANHWIGSFKK